MTNRTAYVDHQRLARDFKVGDSVLLPIYTRGNRYAPSIGRVTAVLDGIGFVDVETSFGNIRISPEYLVKDNNLDTSYFEDTSMMTWERAKARSKEDLQKARERMREEKKEKAAKVASSYVRDRLRPLIAAAHGMCQFGLSEMEAYELSFSKFSSTHSDDEIKRSVSTAYSPSEYGKIAVYWRAKGRRYMPSKGEVSSGIFHCPKCKCELKKTQYKKHTKLYGCPECLWLIRPSDLLEPGAEIAPLENEELRQDAVDFFTPNDPLFRSLYGDKSGD